MQLEMRMVDWARKHGGASEDLQSAYLLCYLMRPVGSQGMMFDWGAGIKQWMGGGNFEVKICMIYWRRGQGGREDTADCWKARDETGGLDLGERTDRQRSEPTDFPDWGQYKNFKSYKVIDNWHMLSYEFSLKTKWKMSGAKCYVMDDSV